MTPARRLVRLRGAPGGVVVALAAVSADGGAERRLDARAVARRLLAEATGLDESAVTVTARCPDCGGDHGRPRASIRVGDADGPGRPAAVSVTHPTPGVAVVAVSASASALGIDAEPIRDGRDADALRKWTRIEAVLKADGRGLRVEPDAVRFDGDTARAPGDPRAWRLQRIAAPGLVVSLASPAAPGTPAAAGGTATAGAL